MTFRYGRPSERPSNNRSGAPTARVYFVPPAALRVCLVGHTRAGSCPEEATTLAGGAGYGLPGDGWRAILQLVLGALLLAAITSRRTARNAVIAAGLLYAAQTLLGIQMHDLLGIIPVDGRDHVVHPAIAILALIAAAATRPGRVERQAQPTRME